MLGLRGHKEFQVLQVLKEQLALKEIKEIKEILEREVLQGPLVLVKEE
jgi:hypothetical protein